jgi:O-acetylhomoserine/O-acetylserine sulfhydrylase-like pyridoxal-dependent enzyme
MKLVQITVHFEFADAIAEILDRHEVVNYVRYPMMEGRDRDGRHYGSQVFPGNTTVVAAQVPDERVDRLLGDLATFRDARHSHGHLEALVLPIERRLEPPAAK